MEITILIVLAVAGLVLGVVLDNLVHLLLRKDTAPGKAASTPVETPAEPLKVAPPASGPSGLAEIARLFDENETHILVVEIGGQQFHQVGELDAEKHALLDTTLERLSNWLRKPLAQPQPATLDTPALNGSKEAVQPVSSPVAGITNPPTLVELSSDKLQPVRKVSLNPVDVVVKALQPDVPKPPVMKSLAEQVDEILQEKLLQSPLRDKKVCLKDLPSGGLVVVVGLENYDGIDAVPDEQVKALLREAVDEWGRRASSRKI